MFELSSAHAWRSNHGNSVLREKPLNSKLVFTVSATSGLLELAESWTIVMTYRLTSLTLS